MIWVHTYYSLHTAVILAAGEKLIGARLCVRTLKKPNKNVLDIDSTNGAVGEMYRFIVYQHLPRTRHFEDQNHCNLSCPFY